MHSSAARDLQLSTQQRPCHPLLGISACFAYLQLLGGAVPSGYQLLIGLPTCKELPFDHVTSWC